MEPPGSGYGFGSKAMQRQRQGVNWTPKSKSTGPLGADMVGSKAMQQICYGMVWYGCGNKVMQQQKRANHLPPFHDMVVSVLAAS